MALVSLTCTSTLEWVAATMVKSSLRHPVRALSQAIPSAGHGNDVPPVLRTFAQRLSQHEDVAAEVGLLHKSIRPDRFHQIIFSDDLDRAAENQEDLKRLRRQRNRLARTKQDFPFSIHEKRAELVEFLFRPSSALRLPVSLRGLRLPDFSRSAGRRFQTFAPPALS